MQYLRNERGSVTTYTAIFTVLALGAGTVGIDFGRAAVLHSQMQARADAGAMAGAVQLDGRPGAQDRARQVAINGTAAQSGIASNGSDLIIQTVNFYNTYNPPVAATDDSDSHFVEVILAPKRVDLIFSPMLDMLAGSTGDGYVDLDAKAVASAEPFVCNAPPLMICDFSEIDPSLDLRLPANAGRQIRLKEPGGGAWAPGNFGLLSLPDGASGANDIEGALAAVTPADCYDIDVETATGSKTNKVKDGINARFDLAGNSWPYPAPNVINYLRDANLIADPAANVGDGNWDINAYWTAKHGAAAPADLAGATRYQSYLYELGNSFARNGKETLYPLPNPIPAGFTAVTPPPADVPVAADPANSQDPDFDGVPDSAVSPNGQARRLVQVTQLKCLADNIHGNGTYPTYGNYIEMFITETVQDPPEAAIYAEVVRPLTAINSPEYYANVRLIE